MKPSFLPCVNFSSLLQSIKKNTSRLPMLIIVLSCAYACGHRYVNKKIDLNKKDRTEVIQKYQPKKYFILHNRNTDSHLTEVFINEQNGTLVGRTMEVNPAHTLYKPIPGKTSHKFNQRLGEPQNEIHLYTGNDVDISPSKEVELPISKIDSIIVHNTDTGYEVIKVLGITAGAVVVVTALIAALKSSCPFVYSSDGAHYAFEGELYPGAIRPTMERTDYFPLKFLKPKEGVYTLKVANELKEIQYTNNLKLIEVLHEEDFTPMIDQQGNIHTVQRTLAPLAMKVGEKVVDVKPIKHADLNSYLFNDISDNKAFQDLTLQFKRPEKAESAKLIMRLKNSYWLDYIFGKFYEKFGSSFNEFQQKNRNQPYKKSLKWLREQGILLDISVKEGDDWKLVEQLQTVGPLSYRDIVVPIDLSGIKSESLEVKLSCGFMFWEVDKIHIDFSENQKVELNILNMFRAIDQDGLEVTDLLIEKDDNRLVQPNIGDEVFVHFQGKARPRSGFKTSLFLENSGFYEYIRSYDGMANRAELVSFRQAGAFTRFSQQSYFDFVTGLYPLEDMVMATLGD